MAEEFQEKTEQATPRKKQKAKEKGQILRNKELVSLAATGGLLTVFYFGGEYLLGSLSSLTGGILGLRYGTDPMEVSKVAVLQGAKIILPFLFASVVMGTLASVAQGGWTLKPFTFDI